MRIMITATTGITDTQRIADLEQELAALHQQDDRLRAIVDTLDDIVWSQDPTTFHVLYLNPAVERVFGHPAHAFFDDETLWLELIHPADRPQVETFLQTILDRGSAAIEYRVTVHQETRWIADRGRLIRDAQGVPLRVDGIATDVTARKQAEAEIARQYVLLDELSTPLIPLSNDLVVMPLIGTMDSRRIAQVIEVVLHGVAARGVRVVILDITGVPIVDTQVAQGLLRAAHSVKLLGAHVIVTGIRPEVAQTLVTIGADLRSIVTRATLQEGIAYAMRVAAHA